jgi:transposase-like protein
VSGQNRVFSQEFKQGVVDRIVNGEKVSSLQRELHIKRSVLYRWRDAYRKNGAAGLRLTGRPPGIPATPRRAADTESAAAQHILELERKVGQQALDLDFLRRAFRRVKESRRQNPGNGATASTRRSEA